jgi:hypothetical protein
MAQLGILRGIEHGIEGLFEGVFGRAFRAHVQPVELARKLAKEMDDHKTVSVSRVYVPNDYVLYLAPKDRAQFRGYEASLLQELAGYLAEHARRQGYTLIAAPRVLLEEDGDLAIGEFGIATRLAQPEPAPRPPAFVPPKPEPEISTSGAEPEPPGQPEPVAEPVPTAEVAATRVYVPESAEPVEPERTVPAAVLLAGARHELDRSVMTVGRSKECDIVIEDPSASRQHAELRRENGAYWIVDLGSTNGTEVNGKRVERAQLETGDRITVGQTELLFERASP